MLLRKGILGLFSTLLIVSIFSIMGCSTAQVGRQFAQNPTSAVTVPDQCKIEVLESVLDNLVANAQYLTWSARSIVSNSLRAECPNYQHAANIVLNKLKFTNRNVLLTRFHDISNKYRAIKLDLMLEKGFPSSWPPANLDEALKEQRQNSGFNVHVTREIPLPGGGLTPFAIDPLINLESRINKFVQNPIRMILDDLSHNVMVNSLPVILKNPTESIQSLAKQLDPKSGAADLKSVLTEEAYVELKKLPAVKQDRFLATLQAYTAFTPMTDIPTTQLTTSEAIKHIDGLIETFRKADQRLADESSKANEKVQVISTAMTWLVATASNSQLPMDTTAATNSAKIQVFAAAALQILQTTSLNKLTQSMDKSQLGFFSELSSDSKLRGILENTRAVIENGSSIVQIGSNAAADTIALLDFAENTLGLKREILEPVRKAANGLATASNILASVSSGNVFGAVSAIGELFGLGGGPSETELLQAHIDQRLDAIDSHLSRMDSKLDVLLNNQKQLLNTINEVNQKIDKVMSEVAKTRTDILLAIDKVIYNELYTRQMTADLMLQKTNRCEFLSKIVNKSTYTEKQNFIAGVPNDLMDCTESLRDLFGEDSRPLSIFNLEALAGVPNITDMQSYLEHVIKPVITLTTKIKKTSCEINSLANPVFVNPLAYQTYQNIGILVSPPCEGIDLEQPAQVNQAIHDKYKSKIEMVNDSRIKSIFSDMLNYEVVRDFSNRVLSSTPYLFLADRDTLNHSLMGLYRLSRSLDNIDKTPAKFLVTQALLLTNTAIAQQAALAGIGIDEDIADIFDKAEPHSLNFGTYNTDENEYTANSLSTNKLLLTNVLRKSVTEIGWHNDSRFKDFVAGKEMSIADMNHFFRKFMKHLVQDSATPSKFYLMVGLPKGIPNDEQYLTPWQVGKLDRLMILMDKTNWDCSSDFFFKPGLIVKIVNGILDINNAQKCHYDNTPDFRGVVLLPLDPKIFANLGPVKTTAEMTALLAQRERLYWALTELEALDKLPKKDLEFLAALDLLQ